MFNTNPQKLKAKHDKAVERQRKEADRIQQYQNKRKQQVAENFLKRDFRNMANRAIREAKKWYVIGQPPVGRIELNFQFSPDTELDRDQYKRLEDILADIFHTTGFEISGFIAKHENGKVYIKLPHLQAQWTNPPK